MERTEHKIVPIESLRQSDYNPREKFNLDELVESIKEMGVLQEPVVTPDDNRPNTYTIVMGERRWRAAKAAGLKEMAVKVIYGLSAADLCSSLLTENAQRQDLTVAERGHLCVTMLEKLNMTPSEIARKLGKAETSVKKWMQIYRRLTKKVQEMIAPTPISGKHTPEGYISGGDAEVLTKVPLSEESQVELAEYQAKHRKAQKVFKRAVGILADNPEYTSEEVFQLAEESFTAGDTTSFLSKLEDSESHTAMTDICMAVLAQKGYKVAREIGYQGTRADVLARKDKDIIFIECETIKGILNKRKAHVDGLNNLHVLAFPKTLLARYEEIWFIDHDIRKIVPFRK